MLKILSIEDYKSAKEFMEIDPLFCAWDNDKTLVYMPIQLRVEIQNSLFSLKDRTASLSKFYRWCWDHKQKEKRCEETQTPLYVYRAIHISHILSRGAHCEKSYDPRNVNILIPSAHTLWETGTEEQKQKMKIYWRNQSTIQLLNSEYTRLQAAPQFKTKKDGY